MPLTIPIEVIYRLACCAIDVTVLFLNPIIISVIYNDRQLRKQPSTIYIANLALVDMCLAAVNFTDLLFHILEVYKLYPMCMMAHFYFPLALQSGSLLFMFTNSVDRFVFIKMSLKYNALMNSKIAKYVSITIWTYSIFFPLFPYVIFGHAWNYDSCHALFQSELYKYGYMTVVIIYIGTTVLTCIMFVSVFRVVQKSRRLRHISTGSPTLARQMSSMNSPTTSSIPSLPAIQELIPYEHERCDSSSPHKCSTKKSMSKIGFKNEEGDHSSDSHSSATRNDPTPILASGSIHDCNTNSSDSEPTLSPSQNRQIQPLVSDLRFEKQHSMSDSEDCLPLDNTKESGNVTKTGQKMMSKQQLYQNELLKAENTSTEDSSLKVKIPKTETLELNKSTCDSDGLANGGNLGQNTSLQLSKPDRPAFLLSPLPLMQLNGLPAYAKGKDYITNVSSDSLDAVLFDDCKACCRRRALQRFMDQLDTTPPSNYEEESAAQEVPYADTTTSLTSNSTLARESSLEDETDNATEQGEKHNRQRVSSESQESISSTSVSTYNTKSPNHKVQKSSKPRKRKSPLRSVSTITTTSMSSNSVAFGSASYTGKDLRTIKILFIMFCVYIILWMPSITISTLRYFYVDITLDVAVMGYAFAVSNSVFNFFVYPMRIPKLRVSFKQLFKKAVQDFSTQVRAFCARKQRG